MPHLSKSNKIVNLQKTPKYFKTAMKSQIILIQIWTFIGKVNGVFPIQTPLYVSSPDEIKYQKLSPLYIYS